MHEKLRHFFNGAVDQVLSAFTASEGSSNETMGSLRESGLRRVFEHTLPQIVRLHRGDVIDSFGQKTGQLDGVVTHVSAPALALNADDDRVIFAEGVVAVLEVKSDISKQWSQVVR